jgi:hypothetical protein
MKTIILYITPPFAAFIAVIVLNFAIQQFYGSPMPQADFIKSISFCCACAFVIGIFTIAPWE